MDRETILKTAEVLSNAMDTFVKQLKNKESYMFRSLEPYSKVVSEFKNLNESLQEYGLYEYDLAMTTSVTLEEFIEMFISLKYNPIEQPKKKNKKDETLENMRQESYAITLEKFISEFRELVHSEECLLGFNVSLSDKDKETEKGKTLLKLVDEVQQHLKEIEQVCNDGEKHDELWQKFRDSTGKALIDQIVDVLKDPNVDQDEFHLHFPDWENFNQVKTGIIPVSFEV